MKRRVFNIGHHIWFVLHYDGKLYGLEEHDHYAGGGLSKSSIMSWEQMFLKCVGDRVSGVEYKTKVLAAAEEFLKSDETNVMV